jgi:hypothetical protein
MQALGAGDRLDILFPVPAGLHDHPADDEVVELEGLGPAARVFPNVIRMLEPLALESGHAWDCDSRSRERRAP